MDGEFVTFLERIWYTPLFILTAVVITCCCL